MRKLWMSVIVLAVIIFPLVEALARPGIHEP